MAVLTRGAIAGPRRASRTTRSGQRRRAGQRGLGPAGGSPGRGSSACVTTRRGGRAGNLARRAHSAHSPTSAPGRQGLPSPAHPHAGLLSGGVVVLVLVGRPP